jgi:hypothetical protein
MSVCSWQGWYHQVPARLAKTLCRGQEKRTIRDTPIQVENSGFKLKNEVRERRSHED